MLVWQTQIFEVWPFLGPYLYVNISHMTHVTSQATVTAWDCQRQHFVYLAKPVLGLFVYVRPRLKLLFCSALKGWQIG
jgi:hypothetical protein